MGAPPGHYKTRNGVLSGKPRSWGDASLSGEHVNPSRAIAAIALSSIFAISQNAAGAQSDGPKQSRPGQDKASAIVQLKGDPLSTYAKTKPPQGKKIDFDSSTV